jgi:hypothetical protein
MCPELVRAGERDGGLTDGHERRLQYVGEREVARAGWHRSSGTRAAGKEAETE